MYGSTNIPLEVVIAKLNFKISENLALRGYRLVNTEKLRSIIYEYVVLIRSEAEYKSLWFCLAEGISRDEGKSYFYAGKTSTMSKHLKSHSLVSSKTILPNGTQEDHKNYVQSLKISQLCAKDVTKLLEYSWAFLIVRGQLSFKLFADLILRVIFNISCVNAINTRYCVPPLKNQIWGMHCSVRQTIEVKIKDALNDFGHKILRINIDLWK